MDGMISTVDYGHRTHLHVLCCGPNQDLTGW